MDYYSYVDFVNDGINRTTTTNFAGEILDNSESIQKWIDIVNCCKSKGGMVFFCGNGASATMAEHMSHDWFQNAEINTTTVSETSHLTAISNDLSFEDVFAYRINRIMTEKDILVTISASGNSKNIIKAIEAAKRKGAYCITLSGMKEDNMSRKLGDLNFYVPLNAYGLVESAHSVILHAALDCFLDKYMGGIH